MTRKQASEGEAAGRRGMDGWMEETVNRQDGGTNEGLEDGRRGEVSPRRAQSDSKPSMNHGNLENTRRVHHRVTVQI